MIYNFSFSPHSVLLMPHTTCSPAEDDFPASSSGSLAPSDVDSIPTASTPRDAEDAEVGSQEGTHQEEEAPEVPQGSLPDFAPDSGATTGSGAESGAKSGRLPCGTSGASSSWWVPFRDPISVSSRGEEAVGSEVLSTSDVPKDPLDEAGRSSLGGLQGCMRH